MTFVQEISTEMQPETPVKPSPCRTSCTSRTSLTEPISRNSSIRRHTPSRKSEGNLENLFHFELRRAASIRRHQGASPQDVAPVARALKNAASKFVSNSTQDISFYGDAIDLATGMTSGESSTRVRLDLSHHDRDMTLTELVGTLANHSKTIISRQKDEIRCLRLTVKELISELLDRNRDERGQSSHAGLPDVIQIQESSHNSSDGDSSAMESEVMESEVMESELLSMQSQTEQVGITAVNLELASTPQHQSTDEEETPNYAAKYIARGNVQQTPDTVSPKEQRIRRSAGLGADAETSSLEEVTMSLESKMNAAQAAENTFPANTDAHGMNADAKDAVNRNGAFVERRVAQKTALSSNDSERTQRTVSEDEDEDSVIQPFVFVHRASMGEDEIDKPKRDMKSETAFEESEIATVDKAKIPLPETTRALLGVEDEDDSDVSIQDIQPTQSAWVVDSLISEIFELSMRSTVGLANQRSESRNSEVVNSGELSSQVKVLHLGNEVKQPRKRTITSTIKAFLARKAIEKREEIPAAEEQATSVISAKHQASTSTDKETQVESCVSEDDLDSLSSEQVLGDQAKGVEELDGSAASSLSEDLSFLDEVVRRLSVVTEEDNEIQEGASITESKASEREQQSGGILRKRDDHWSSDAQITTTDNSGQHKSKPASGKAISFEGDNSEMEQEMKLHNFAQRSDVQVFASETYLGDKIDESRSEVEPKTPNLQVSKNEEVVLVDRLNEINRPSPPPKHKTDWRSSWGQIVKEATSGFGTSDTDSEKFEEKKEDGTLFGKRGFPSPESGGRGMDADADLQPEPKTLKESGARDVDDPITQWSASTSQHGFEPSRTKKVEATLASQKILRQSRRHPIDRGDDRPYRPHRPPTRRRPEDFLSRTEPEFVFPVMLNTMFMREDEAVLMDPLIGIREESSTENDTDVSRKNSHCSIELLASIGLDDTCDTLEQYVDVSDI